MGHVVEVNDVLLAVDELPDVGDELSRPDAVRGAASREGRGRVAVDLAILPVPQTIDGIGHLLRDAGRAVGAVDELAWQGFVVALTGGQVVVVVVKGCVEPTIVGRDAGDVVEGLEELLSLVQMSLPLGVSARLNGVEEI